MNGFGFRLSPSSAINLDKIDRTLFDELCRIEPDALRCMACGSCTATCTSSGLSGMSVRKMLLNLQRGKVDDIRMHALREMHDGVPERHKDPSSHLDSQQVI